MVDAILTFVRDILTKCEKFLASDIIEAIRAGIDSILGKKEGE